MNAAFDALPDSADCWVYASDRPLDTEEVRLLEGLFQSFEREWSSHGRKVVGACQVVDARVVVVAASVQQGDISGCGIDKSLHLLQDVAASRGFSWVSALQIVYRDSSGQLQVSSRKAFREEAAAGRVNEDTWVVDLSLRHLGALRVDGLERRVADSWHASLMPVPTGA